MTTNTDKLIQELCPGISSPFNLFPGHGYGLQHGLAILVPYVAVVLLMMGARQDLPVADVGHAIPSRTDLLVRNRCHCSRCRFCIRDSRPAAALLGMATAAARGMARNSRGKLCAGWREYLSLHHDLTCLPYIVLLGTAPAIVLWIMLRRGAPLTPRWTAALAALAAAGLGNFCVRLGHPEDVTVMLLVWHAGGVIVLAALASVAGRTFLNWRSITGACPNFRSIR